jgi:hypothetical protein
MFLKELLRQLLSRCSFRRVYDHLLAFDQAPYSIRKAEEQFSQRYLRIIPSCACFRTHQVGWAPLGDSLQIEMTANGVAVELAAAEMGVNGPGEEINSFG